MAFEPHKISFDNGVRQDLNNIDADQPSMLTSATNVMYTTKGSIIGRYSVDGQNSRVQKINNAGGAVVQDSTNLSDVVINKIHAGVEASDNQVFALYQGSSYIKVAQTNVWRETSNFWSTKRYNSPVLDSRLVTGLSLVEPTAVGSSLIGVPVTVSSSVGLGIIDENKLSVIDTQSLSNYDGFSRFNQCITTLNGVDYIFYPKADGSIYMHSVSISTPGAGTEIRIVAPGSCQLSFSQTLWVTAGVNELFLAYITTAATNIIVNRITATGSVTATINLVGGSNITGVSLCHNGSATGSGGKLCVGWADTGTSDRFRTKILNCISTVSITDAALDVNHGTGLFGVGFYFGHSLGTVNGQIIAIFSNGNAPAKLQFDVRQFSSTTVFTAYNLVNTLISGTTFRDNVWRVFTPATLFCGRTVVGIYKEINGGTTSVINQQSQWIILDITNCIVAVNSGPVFIAAAGSPGRNISTPPINVNVSSGTTTRANVFTFGVVDGIEYNILGPVKGGARLIKLQATGAKSILVNGISMFSGSTPYIYDGIQMIPTGFTEGAPQILSATRIAGGVLPATNTASLQAIWQINNSKGQLIRSAQSNIATVTGIVGNGQFNVNVSVPQMLSKYLSSTNTVSVKLYSTEFNPSAGAPLYLISELNPTLVNGVISVGLVTFSGVFGASVPNTSAEQLYTGGNIFDDQAPESADRGIAFVNNRIWVADQDRVYVSKILSRQFAPAFNSNSSKLIIEMPTSIGEIQSLGTLEDKVAVIGSLGTAIIYGPGFDDIGNGPGWAVQTTSGTGAYVDSLINQTGPRISCNIPNVGVAFAGPNTDLYIMNNGGQVQVLTRALKDDVRPVSDVLFVDAGKSTISHGPMLLMVSGDGSGFIKYYDIESGRVSQWALGTITSFCTNLNGNIFRQGFDAAVGISSLTEARGQDLNIPFGQTIVTGNVSITGAIDNALSNAWGRLRSVNVLHDNASQYNLGIQVVADRSDVAIIDKNIDVVPEFNQKWPYSQFEEFRTTSQRCSTFVVTLNAVPATAEWAGIEFWSSVNADRAPSRNRR